MSLEPPTDPRPRRGADLSAHERPPSPTALGCVERAALYRENARQMSRLASATPLPGVAHKFAVAASRWTMLAAAEDAIGRARPLKP